MKKSYIIGGIIIAASLVFALFSFKSTLTNYVTIEEAISSEQYVQVAGILVKESIHYELDRSLLIFKLREPNGKEMTVHYSKSKPANFDDADKIVVVGKYDRNQNVFIANELLVKCPSKYEERISNK